MPSKLSSRPDTKPSLSGRLLVWVDAAGIILEAGPGLSATIGRAPGALVGEPLSTVLHEGAAVLRHLDTGVGPYTRSLSAVWSSASLRLAGSASGRALVGLRRDGESEGRVRIEIRRLG